MQIFWSLFLEILLFKNYALINKMTDNNQFDNPNRCSGHTVSGAPLTVGQMYFPDDDELEGILGRIYKNRYYTNHGPLAIEFEDSLSVYLGNQEVVVATNATLGLMMTLVALGVKGSVVVPSVAPPGVAEAVIWSGLTPVYCDVDENTVHITVESVMECVKEDTSVIIAGSLWGNVCEFERLSCYAYQSGLEFIHYAVDAFGVSVNNQRVGSCGITTIFSFDTSKFLTCTGGGCVVTNSEILARKIRNIRSSYGAGPFEKVPVTANGRFSEYQAAIGLWSLAWLDRRRSDNKIIYERYVKLLANIDGINLLEIDSSILSNHQDIVLFIDDNKFGSTRDQIQNTLERSNIYTKNDCYTYLNNSDQLTYYHNGSLASMQRVSKKILRLPIGSQVSLETVDDICALIKSCKL